MNQYLRSMTATQQVGAMFLFVFGCLAVAGITIVLLSLRGDGPISRTIPDVRIADSGISVVASWRRHCRALSSPASPRSVSDSS